MINAIKDVAKALSDLIGATKGAASKPADDPSMYQLKGAAKVEWSPSQGQVCQGCSSERLRNDTPEFWRRQCASEFLPHIEVWALMPLDLH